MAKNVVRVRVELKKKYGDYERNFNEMFKEFKRKVSNSGVMHSLKDHQYFQSSSEKVRKKKRDAIKKRQHEQLKQQVIAGERVKASSVVIKKILLDYKKEKAREKIKENNYR